VNNINDQIGGTITILYILESAQYFSGKWLHETCWADAKVNKIVIVTSSWSFILFTYIDDARSNTNQILSFVLKYLACKLTAMLPDILALNICQNGGSIFVVLAWYYKLCFAALVENPADSCTTLSVYLW